MPDVEMTCRLIQEEHFRLLGETHGNQHALPLAPADFRDGPIGNVQDTGQFHRALGDREVMRGFAAEPGYVGPAAHQDNFADWECQAQRMILQ